MKLLQTDFAALASKASTDEVARKLWQEALSQADRLLAVEFPAQPIEDRRPVKKIDDRYTEQYLKTLEQFDKASWLLEGAVRKLAFAYKATGERKYLERFEQAIDSCLINPMWGPVGNEYDHCASRLLRALSVSLTWLGDAVSADRLTAIRARMKKEVRGFEAKYRLMRDEYPIGPNDHQSKDLAGAGCAAWFLLPEDPEMAVCLDRFIALFRDKLIEETIAEDGAWPDGWSCVLYALMDVIAFFEVIEARTGQDLTAHPRLRQTCDFMLACLPQHRPAGYPYCHGLFWMAATYGRSDLQFVCRNMVLNGQADLDYSEYALICYDEGLEARELEHGGAMAFRSLGWGRLGWGTNPDGVYVWLKSGATDAFCRNNQNGLVVTAFGRQLFSDVVIPARSIGLRAFWNCVYEDGLWTTKCATALLVNGQNQLRNRYGEDWAPIMKFHHPNRPKWGDDDAWWYDLEAPKAPLGRIVSVKSGDDAASLVGRADRGYGDLLSGYTRTCAMTRDGLIVIVDRLTPSGLTESFQFRANTAYTFYLKGENRAAITAEDVASDILFLYDGESSGSGENSESGESGENSLGVDKWPFQPGPGNYLTGSFPLRGSVARLVTVMRPYRDGREHELTAQLQEDQLTVVFDGKLYGFDLADLESVPQAGNRLPDLELES